ncbi:MAG: transcription antitermination factor NusB [Bacteroidales bacterium]|nr:transcription antitermination factor NusB [Bacteroidales bacterium]
MRTKTLQALFEYEIGQNTTSTIGEKNLFTNINHLKTISLSQFQIILEFKRLALDRIEAAKKKYLPTEADLNPNLKFANLRIFKILEENISYQDEISKEKIDIHSDIDIIRLVFQNIINSETYANFMNVEDDSFDDEKDFIISIFKDYMVNSDALASAFADKKLHWYADFFEAALVTARTIKNLDCDMKNDEVFPLLNIDIEDHEDDVMFVKTIYRSVIQNSDKYIELITSRLHNWDLDRLATLDLIILKMAIAEFIECPSVPIKVTINEYIELSKDYSTPKSKSFINGLLDRISSELLANETIKKTGRGLISQ